MIPFNPSSSPGSLRQKVPPWCIYSGPGAHQSQAPAHQEGAPVLSHRWPNPLREAPSSLGAVFITCSPLALRHVLIRLTWICQWVFVTIPPIRTFNYQSGPGVGSGDAQTFKNVYIFNFTPPTYECPDVSSVIINILELKHLGFVDIVIPRRHQKPLRDK